MPTLPRITMTLMSDPQVLHDLAAILRTKESEVRSGQSKLSLLSVFLSQLVRDLHLLSLHSSPLPPTTVVPEYADAVRQDLEYLESLMRGASFLKIIHNYGTLQGTISLTLFRSLRYLELKRLPLHLLKGLTTLRGQLETLVSVRSAPSLESLLEKCGADASDPYPWPNLRALHCVECDLEQLDSSLRFAPVLQVLDLRYARVTYR